MCGVGRLLARPRIGAQFTLRAAGVLSSCGVSAKVSPQILLRLRPRIVGLNEGRGCGGALSRSLFRGVAAKPRAALGIEGDLVADPDGLEGYGCKREIVVGVVLFHKLIEAECHIDWNVQDLALFAEVLVA